jgi:hypothetical protein
MITGNDQAARNEANEDDEVQGEKAKEDLEDAEDAEDSGKASGAPAFTHQQIFGDSGETQRNVFG